MPCCGMVAVKRAALSCAMAYQYWSLLPEVAGAATVDALLFWQQMFLLLMEAMWRVVQ